MDVTIILRSRDDCGGRVTAEVLCFALCAINDVLIRRALRGAWSHRSAGFLDLGCDFLELRHVINGKTLPLPLRAKVTFLCGSRWHLALSLGRFGRRDQTSSYGYLRDRLLGFCGYVKRDTP
ncbi:unnamed protein product [Dibothriocephalus latus]|uniref:Uncharacterized protein n=1 Tax=Dibothriocephalus latus TaxID=60516 RepID=A0A3P7LBN7_DIBLA|nr:unnamed protein product [Dibothriocephalus latus]